MGGPEVSIVTATYNRPQILRFSIESLLASTVEDWELIVVGDACTDDTAAVVAEFGDARIRFVNLPVNSGEQSGPNNEGARLSRGRYLAFLNHDDLWTPDHLRRAIDHLQRTQAHFVSTLTLAMQPSGEAVLAGSLGHEYSPWSVAPASSWVMERDFFDAVGPWRAARETYLAPSQEWLYRAWKQRRQLTSLHVPTVLAIQSGNRPNSYADGAWQENEAWARRLRDEPDLLMTLMADIAIRHQAAIERPAVRPHAARATKNLVRKLLFALGRNPVAVHHAVRYRRKGGLIDSLRRTRGLPPLDRRTRE